MRASVERSTGRRRLNDMATFQEVSMEQHPRRPDNRSASHTAGSIALLATLVALAFGAMFYFTAGDRPATTATGFAPVVDQVRPIPAPSTTGQGGGP
jgi:hypothetical protein